MSGKPGRPQGNPNAPILLMMGLVPVIVVVAVVVVILLARSGFGILVSLGLPFGISMVVIVLLGVWLARRASRNTRGGDESGDVQWENRRGNRE